jgi:sec-independent protein translocase protein TatA
MGGFSIWHWLIVGIVILLLFGKGRFSDMMGDVAKGLKSFKKGISEDDEQAAGQRRIGEERVIEQPPASGPAAPAPAAEASPTERGSTSEADRH